MATLLTYALNTFPFPLQASPASGNAQIGTLTLVATNATDSSVSLAGLIVTIPVGPDGPDAAQYLTGSTAGINAVPPSGWPSATTNPGTGTMDYIFTPPASSAKLSTGDATQPSVKIAPGDSLTVSLTNISINATPGTVEIVVTEGSDGQPTKKFPITKFPAGWGVVDFEVDPPIVNAGGSTTLNWNGPSGATYTIEYYTPQTGIVNVPAQGEPPLSNEGTYPGAKQPPLTLQDTTMFTLSVSMSDGTQPYQAQVQKQVTIAESPPVISSFTGQLISSGNQMIVSLSWKTNADGCIIKANGDITVQPSDTLPLTASAAAPLLNQYTLVATNQAGSASSTLTVGWGIQTSIPVPSAIAVAISPDQTRVYVVSLDNGTSTGNGTLLMLSRATLQPIGSPLTIGINPTAIALSADGMRAYVSNDVSYNVNTVDTSTNQLALLGPAVGVGPEPMTIAITHDGKTVFTANADNATVSVLTTSSDPNNPLSSSKTLSLNLTGNMPAAIGLAMSPDGKNAYVGGCGDNTASAVLMVIDPVQAVFFGTPTVIGNIPASATSVSVTPDNSCVLVGVGQDGSGGVIAYQPTGNPASPLKFAGLHLSADGIQVVQAAPDSKSVYVVTGDDNLNGILTTVDIATMKAVGSPLGGIGLIPTAMAVSADGTGIYITSTRDGNFWSLAPTSLVGGTPQKSYWRRGRRRR